MTPASSGCTDLLPHDRALQDHELEDLVGGAHPGRTARIIVKNDSHGVVQRRSSIAHEMSHHLPEDERESSNGVHREVY